MIQIVLFLTLCDFNQLERLVEVELNKLQKWIIQINLQ